MTVWHPFGADASAVLVAFNPDGTFTRAAAATATVWDSMTGGTQYTDPNLLTWSGVLGDATGTAITQATADANGILVFQAPASDVWLDFGRKSVV